MQWYLAALKKYATFEGRARRREYWFFILFLILIGIGLGVVEGLLGTGGIVMGLFMLAMLVPNIAVTIRRLHDSDHSGWWFLAYFVPILNLVPFVFMFFNGTAGANRFGPDPKAGPA